METRTNTNKRKNRINKWRKKKDKSRLKKNYGKTSMSIENILNMSFSGLIWLNIHWSQLCIYSPRAK